MYVRVTAFQIPPDQLSKALQVAEEVAVPASGSRRVSVVALTSLTARTATVSLTF